MLSKRETQVMLELIKGKSNREIAEALEISINTLKSHLKKIFGKLKVENRTAASLTFLQQMQHDSSPEIE